MSTDSLRDYIYREVQRTSASAVARRLGVSYRIIPTYLVGACKFRSAAELERRCAELNWPPPDDSEAES